MKRRPRRFLPWAAVVCATCMGLCAVATRHTVGAQDVEAEAGEASPPKPADEAPAAVQPAADAVTPEPQAAPPPVDPAVDAVTPAPQPLDPAGNDPQSAAPLEGQPAADTVAVALRPKLAPASLDGVQLGVTTRKELHEKWGQPRNVERIAGGARESFRVEKLGPVRVTISEDVVSALSVHVENPLALEIVAARLAIDDVEPVDVFDEQGELLGAAYPPRGVLVGYVPRSKPPRVFQIIIEPIDAQAFLARAEFRLANRYADCLADVKQALELAPGSGLAHRLHSEVALRGGDLDTALKEVQHAIELEPADLGHRLFLARVLAAAGDYPQAISRVRDVLDQPSVPDVVAARAWCQWGDYLSQSAHRDYAEAIKHHQQAIKLAEPLVRHERHVVRRAAKELLVDAHLAVAYDVGRGHWQQKSIVVPKWIDRAAAFADELLANDRGSPEVYLRVYSGAVAALAGIADPPDASKWIRGVRQHGKRMYDQAADPAYRARLSWELALALGHAVELEAARHEPDGALALANMAQSLFDESSPVAGRLPTYNYERGRLCYQLGAVYAAQRGDHAGAIAWFDRAAPLLEKPVPAAAVDPGTEGDTFVSMAVSYWHADNRREALRLTTQGLKLMERAVLDGTLDARALATPYNNLSSMHEALGQLDEAQKYAELATRHEAETTK